MPCPLPDCTGGEHHYHDVNAYAIEGGHDCARAASIGYRCYNQHRPGLSEPVSLPEVTDEMVERATTTYIGASGYADPGMRAALTEFRAELLAGSTRWQPIEHDEIKAGMRIRATTADPADPDYVTIHIGVAHRTGEDGDWLTERAGLLTGWIDPTTYEVDSATIPADPDVELIEAVAEILYRTNWPSDMWDGLSVEAYRELARAALTAIRAHDEAVTGDE